MYQVSNYGNVRMKTKDGYITVKQRLNPNGYTTVSLANELYMPLAENIRKGHESGAIRRKLRRIRYVQRKIIAN